MVFRKPGIDYGKTEEVGLGVYIVPSSDEPLYRIGSSIIGYDIRTQASYRVVPNMALPSINEKERDNYVGNLKFFGFHASLSDALAYKKEDMARILDEIRDIAAHTPAFLLTNGRFYDEFHLKNSIAITFDDPEGYSERLHAKLVVRINRFSIGSDYTDINDPLYSPRQKANMLDFCAPFILSDFKLHMTLASNVPKKDKELLKKAVIQKTGLFANYLGSSLSVDNICLVERKPNGFWRISESFKLKANQSIDSQEYR